MTVKTQLANVRKKLTGQQAVLAYFAEAIGRFDSFGAWAEHATLTKGQAPLNKAAEAAKEAVRSAMKGQPREAVHAAEREAVRDAVFLALLFMDVARGLSERARRYSLEATVCAREVQLLLLQQLLAEAAQGAPGPGDGLMPDISADRIAAVRDRIEDHLATLYLERLTIAVAERNYFGGQSILFQQDARRLADSIDWAEAIAGEFNEFVRSLDPRDREVPSTADGAPCSPADLAVDVQAAKQRARAQVRVEATYSVNLAKAQALVKLGRDQEGCDLAIESYRSRYGRAEAFDRSRVR